MVVIEGFEGQFGGFGYIIEAEKVRPLGKHNYAAKVRKLVYCHGGTPADDVRPPAEVLGHHRCRFIGPSGDGAEGLDPEPRDTADPS